MSTKCVKISPSRRLPGRRPGKSHSYPLVLRLEGLEMRNERVDALCDHGFALPLGDLQDIAPGRHLTGSMRGERATAIDGATDLLDREPSTVAGGDLRQIRRRHAQDGRD